MEYDPNKMSWAHKWLNIPFIWNDLNTQGANATVAIIDTGIDLQHNDLITNIDLRNSKNIVDTSINDSDGHGTSMAGIIGSNGTKVYGVAPNVKLVIIKAALQTRGADIKKYAEALDYASTIPEVDIISFSNIFLTNDNDLQNAVNKCTSSNKIIVAGIGNNRNFMLFPDGPDQDTFPACYDNVVSVGAFDQDGKISAFSNWNSHLSLLAPGENILTTSINNAATIEKGTSIATAFTSGCLALMISYAKSNSIQSQKCVQALLNSCDDIGNSVGRDIQSGYGRINLRNAISKIKSI
jgi:subtilisin family serine protease